jgi:hypothetical protein
MNNNTKIPLLSSLGFVLTGFTDDISGEWVAVKGGDNKFPYTQEMCYGGDYNYYDYEYGYAERSEYCYSGTIDLWMTINDDLQGKMVTLYSYSYSYGGEEVTYSDSDISDVVVSSGEDGKYTLYSDGFVLDCTLSDNVTLKCEAPELEDEDDPERNLSPLTFTKSE